MPPFSFFPTCIGIVGKETYDLILSIITINVFVTKELNEEQICWIYTQGPSTYNHTIYNWIVFKKTPNIHYHHFIG